MQAVVIYYGRVPTDENPTNTPAFRKEQALDAWNRTPDFMKLNLKGE